MSKIMKSILVFNIENKQSYYAQCMEFIQAIENKKDMDSYFTKVTEQTFIDEVKGITIALNEYNSQDFTTLIKNCEDKIEKAPEFDKQKFINFVNKNPNYKSYYYFRVHNSEKTDVAEFFYFVLMLQALYILKEQIISCIFSENTSDSKSDYNRFSHFTQLLPLDYRNHLYIVMDKSIRRLAASGKTRRMFPIIEINQSTYKELISTKSLIGEGSISASVGKTSKLAKALLSIVPEDKSDCLANEMIAYANNIAAQGRGPRGKGNAEQIEKKSEI